MLSLAPRPRSRLPSTWVGGNVYVWSVVEEHPAGFALGVDADLGVGGGQCWRSSRGLR